MFFFFFFDNKRTLCSKIQTSPQMILYKSFYGMLFNEVEQNDQCQSSSFKGQVQTPLINSKHKDTIF